MTTSTIKIATATTKNGGGWRRRVAGLLMVLATAIGLLTSQAAAASADAPSVPVGSFAAECSQRAVTAWAPNMRYYPNYYVVWSSELDVYTTAGWRRYLNSPGQTAMGSGVGGLSADWYQQYYTYNNLPRNLYFQVKVTYVWLGRGLSDTYHIGVVPPHSASTQNFDFGSYSRVTSTYCYTD